MSEYTFSVIIPAHNEEKYIGKCLQAVKSAAKYVGDAKTEIIVVANRCTDKTVAIAKHYGAKVVINEEKCIAAIRNAGVREAKGEIIVTIDADSLMTKYSLHEIKFLLDSGNYVGGGTNPKFDRMSVGIAFSSAYVAMNLIPIMMKNGGYLSGAMFWLYKRDFDAIGGFDETLVSLEDMDFAVRLKKLGDKRGQKYGTLKRSYILTSSRKFDEFGDWYLIKNRSLTKRIFSGKDREAADEFYYDVR
ncbi:MAG: glycosyltransferase [Ruminiclostridium sp.]|nr:glycosyltransferase [Ruminiclostridium sp.]